LLPPSPRRQPLDLGESSGPVTLADVAASAAAAVGVRGFCDRIGLGQVQHAVICLVDGLGWQQLIEYPVQAPTLTAGGGPVLTTVFPSTTPTALASLGTGLLPGAHGLVGAMFWVPEFEQVLAPLRWKADPHPVAVQPEATVFERAAEQGVRVTSIGPAAYRNSGLTRAALRGGQYRDAPDAASRVRELISCTDGSGTSLTYIYWRDLDRTGHEHGVGSQRWLAELQRVDRLVDRLVDALPANGVLVVTADHGMVNCPTRVDIDHEPALSAGVRILAGEPRARMVYVEPGQASQVAHRWRQSLDGLAVVMTREEVVEEGLVGPAQDWVAERIGDVVAIASDDVALVSAVDPRASSLLGQHGGSAAAEMLIPCMVYASGAN
jgi:hypothetical protein